MFGGPNGYAIESVEALIREKHERCIEIIEDLVKQRSEINELIKGVRQDAAILESAVARYDRLCAGDQEVAEVIDHLTLDGTE